MYYYTIEMFMITPSTFQKQSSVQNKISLVKRSFGKFWKICTSGKKPLYSTDAYFHAQTGMLYNAVDCTINIEPIMDLQ